jgi:hypothetical protein
MMDLNKVKVLGEARGRLRVTDWAGKKELQLGQRYMPKY